MKEERIRLIRKKKFLFTEEKKKLQVPEYFKRAGEDYEKRYRSQEKFAKHKLLVFRDSFCTTLIPILRQNFSESLFVWETKLVEDIITDEKPDIVILELIERDIDFLKK